MNAPIAQYRGLLATYLRPQRRQVIGLALLLLLGIGLQLLNPQVIGFFIDTTQRGGDRGALLLAALLFIVFGLGERAAKLATTYLSENVAWTATNGLRADLLRHVVRLDMSFHKRRTPGELIERIDGDVTALANFFSQLVVRVAGNGLLIVAVIVLLFAEDWRAGLALAIYAGIVLVALGAVQNLAVRRFAEQRQASAEQFSFLEERISGTEDIRALGAEPYILRRLYGLMRDLRRKHIGAEMVSTTSYVATNLLFALGYALGLGIVAYLYTGGEITIGASV
jgi:ATP-binding cassette, subfamily B, bacterial